jgi:phospholipid/cholesterol/gamma-HCH transport system permease protein
MEASRQPLPRPWPAVARPAWWAERLEVPAGVVRLAVSAVRCWFTPPFSWWREAVNQGWLLVQRCAIPTIISLFAFGYGAPGIQSTSIGEQLGFVDRVGEVFSVASLREFAPWVSGMVVAGAAGTAIAADLGARKIREELDALAVIGVDTVRTLVAPRVLALTLIMPALMLFGLVISALSGAIAVTQFGGTIAAYFATFQAHFTIPDLIANVIKTLGFGFIIAIVCAYKGMNASGGSEGVGRAVNQAVVIAFVSLWVFNFAFNSAYLAAIPTAQDVR